MPRELRSIGVSDPAWSPDGYWIAFSNSSIGVRLASASLSGQHPDDFSYLADTPYLKIDISRDQKRVLFSSTTLGYVAVLDRNDHLVSILVNQGRNPDWSPQEDYIAYVGPGERPLEQQIWLSDAAGNATQLTSSAISRICKEPSWSPDGREIVFSAFIDTNLQICTIPVDGREVNQLTFDTIDHHNPSWSSDGNVIAFDTSNETIGFVSVRDGRILQDMSDTFGRARYPSWAQDSDKLAFWADRGIWVLTVSDSVLAKVADSPQQTYPAWKNNGTLVFVQSTRYAAISVIEPENNEAKVLTDWTGSENDTDPIWVDDNRLFFLRGGKLWSVGLNDDSAAPVDNMDNMIIDNLEISPTRNHLLFDNGTDVFMKPLEAGSSINLSENIDEKLRCPTLSPDERQMASCTSAGLKIFSVMNNSLEEIAFVPGSFLNAVWSSADPLFGSHIAVESGGNINVISLREPTPQLAIRNGQSPTWSPVHKRKLLYSSFGIFLAVRQVFQETD